MRIFLIIVFSSISYSLQAQVGLSGRAMNQFEKGNEIKAEELLLKALQKDSTLSSPYYVKAFILYETDSLYQQIDSAYYYVKQSLAHFAKMDEKSILKHKREGVDSLSIMALEKKIDSVAYKRAEEVNTEASYMYFIEYYQGAPQEKEAVENRNALAYIKANKENTYESYRKFIEKYPEAKQVVEAEEKFERLYYDKSTQDEQLDSYLSFLKKNPDTPYRNEAEQNIFQIVTADNQPQSYRRFIGMFNKGAARKKAIDFLYHILKQRVEELDKHLINDSLKYIDKWDKRVIFPIRENGKYGFMDASGELVITPILTSVGEEMLCGNLDNGIYKAEGGLYAINNAPVYKGKLDAWDDLGGGLVKIEYSGKYGVIHKAGYTVLPIEYDAIKVVDSTFIQYKKGSFWGISTYSGRILTKPLFNDIIWQGDFVVLENGNKYSLKNIDNLLNAANGALLYFDMPYDDFQWRGGDIMWVERGDAEALFNTNLEQVTPLSPQKISMLEKGFYIEKGAEKYVMREDFSVIDVDSIQLASFNKYWGALSHSGYYSLYNIQREQLEKQHIDSVALIGNHFAVSYSSDSVFLHTPDSSVQINKGDKLSLIPATDSNEYVIRQGVGGQVIIDERGKSIYTGSFQEAKALGNQMIIISKMNKGLISNEGKSLLPFVYEAIGNYNDGYISLLRNKKFGIYNYKKELLIPSEYNQNIRPYNQSLLIVGEQGGLGFVDVNNQKFGETSFDEITYWNDSVALVKEDLVWKLYDIYHNEIVNNDIKSIHFVKQVDQESVAIFLKESGYGVYSSLVGEVLPPTFNDIINIGTADTPVYFTEKHVVEAELYIAIYYSQKGNMLYKQVYEPEEYAEIYCDN
ncbi:WG repeat-containing protein [Fulvivirga sediminis]|uniref:WG repeat-containing protein n=1 Tax=Fulvivirga sediminis TaxID=2803949 RepID=A0A937F5G3_9BACT|nr:WG repeat-containing protein [Fulvivirga sediminis]MBL3656777.1 WG repeat-containing protein [Fulvivirga sediminis]